MGGTKTLDFGGRTQNGGGTIFKGVPNKEKTMVQR